MPKVSYKKQDEFASETQNSFDEKAAEQTVAAKKKRGRPKGSKNKPKVASESPKKRGRPKGSKNKPKQPKEVVIDQTTENGSQEEETKSTNSGQTSTKSQEHTNHSSAYRAYIIDRDSYKLHKTFNGRGFGKNVPGNGYFAGRIVLDGLTEFERRCNFYLKLAKGDQKKKLKAALLEDLEDLKKKVDKM